MSNVSFAAAMSGSKAPISPSSLQWSPLKNTAKEKPSRSAIR